MMKKIKAADISKLANEIRKPKRNYGYEVELAKSLFGFSYWSQVYDIIAAIVPAFGLNHDASDSQLYEVFWAIGIEVEE